MKWLFRNILVPVIVIIIGFYLWGSSSSLETPELTQTKSYFHSSLVSKDTFSIVTYNLGYLSGMTNNRPVEPSSELHRENREKAIKLFKALNPDLIAFQEIDFGSARSFEVNQLDSLAKGCDFPYGALTVNWDKKYVPFPYWPPSVHFGQVLSGQAILSKYSFVSQKRVVLEKPRKSPFFYNAFYLDRLVQIVQVDVGRPLVVMNVHLEAFDQETRESQIKVVVELFKEYSYNYPVILLGDFNCPPYFPELDPEAESTLKPLYTNPKVGWAISQKQYGEGPERSYTFNARKPYVKIDHIFFTSEYIQPVSARVLTEADTISDHLPVLMDFVFKKR